MTNIDSCNNLLSSVHNMFVIILRHVRLNFTENIIMLLLVISIVLLADWTYSFVVTF